jgi:hypothetical protein
MTEDSHIQSREEGAGSILYPSIFRFLLFSFSPLLFIFSPFIYFLAVIVKTHNRLGHCAFRQGQGNEGI